MKLHLLINLPDFRHHIYSDGKMTGDISQANTGEYLMIKSKLEFIYNWTTEVTVIYINMIIDINRFYRSNFILTFQYQFIFGECYIFSWACVWGVHRRSEGFKVDGEYDLGRGRLLCTVPLPDTNRGQTAGASQYCAWWVPLPHIEQGQTTGTSQYCATSLHRPRSNNQGNPTVCIVNTTYWYQSTHFGLWWSHLEAIDKKILSEWFHYKRKHI